MQSAFQKAKRGFFVVYLVAIHLVLIYFVGERVLYRTTTIQPADNASVGDPTERTSIPTPIPVPESFADPEDVNANVALPTPTVTTPGLIVPVLGVKPEQLLDTFSDSRSEGRFHDAIDIPAAGGTPVIAAADGEIAKFHDSERGGITVYQLTDDKKFVLYYAHLQRRADEITIGTRVRKGATIGFVGDTGNAGAGNFHLHFSIAAITDPKNFWKGTYLNPYPILRNGTYPQLLPSP